MIPRRTAIAVASVRSFAPTFSRMCLRCTLTVSSAIQLLSDIAVPVPAATRPLGHASGHRAIGNDSDLFQRHVGGKSGKWTSRFDRGSKSSRIVRFVRRCRNALSRGIRAIQSVWRAPLNSMPHRRFPGGFKVANREKQRDGCQRKPRKDAEAVHEGQQAHLMLQLLKEAALRG